MSEQVENIVGAYIIMRDRVNELEQQVGTLSNAVLMYERHLADEGHINDELELQALKIADKYEQEVREKKSA